MVAMLHCAYLRLGKERSESWAMRGPASWRLHWRANGVASCQAWLPSAAPTPAG